MTITDNIFKEFVLLSEAFEEELLEILVRRHQITLVFNTSLLSFNDIDLFFKRCVEVDRRSCYIANNNSEEELLSIVCEIDPEKDYSYNLIKYFIQISDKVFKEICQCPAFEFVVSDSYIKMYLDKQGLTVSDIKAFEKIFEDEDGTLELHGQRPYLLFVNLNKEL